MDALDAEFALKKIDPEEYAKKWKILSDGVADAGDRFEMTKEKIQAQAEGLFGLVDRYQKAIDQARGLTEQQRLVAKATDDATAIWAKYGD